MQKCSVGLYVQSIFLYLNISEIIVYKVKVHYPGFFRAFLFKIMIMIQSIFDYNRVISNISSNVIAYSEILIF